MTVELIVKFINQNGMKQNVWLALNKLRKSKGVELENAILVERDAQGKTFIQQYRYYPAWGPALDDSFLLLFSNALFMGDTNTRTRELMVAEFAECFIEELEKAWLLHYSALLILIPSDSLVNSKELLDYLSDFTGILVHTTFPERLIISILESSKSAEPQVKL